MPAKILVTVAGLVTMGFGIWHFFIPKVWNWYSYIDAAAPELIIAVRAINVFFSFDPSARIREPGASVRDAFGLYRGVLGLSRFAGACGS